MLSTSRFINDLVSTESLPDSDMAGPPTKKTKLTHYGQEFVGNVHDEPVYKIVFHTTGESFETDILQMFRDFQNVPHDVHNIRLEIHYPGHSPFTMRLVNYRHLSTEDVQYYLENMDGSEQEIDVNTPYTFSLLKQKHIAKYNGHESWTRVKFADRWINKNLSDMQDELYKMFDDWISRTLKEYHPDDIVRIYVHHPSLETDISIPATRLRDLKPEVIMNAIVYVLQSHHHLPILQDFLIELGVLKLPRGGAKVSITNYKKDAKKKTSIVVIKNKDNMCMARAIVTGKKQIEGPRREYKLMQKYNHYSQTNQAEDLHVKAGVPMTRMSTFEDLPKFEQAINARVVVFDIQLQKSIVYYGDESKETVIYLCKDGEHFDLISSITGFFGKNRFCHNCLKTYRDNHNCAVTCIVCKQSGCLRTDHPVPCSDCNMTCRSQTCYDQHKVVRQSIKNSKKQNLSPCQRYWKCPTCFKVLNTVNRKKSMHQCGETFCYSCKTYVVGEHFCYMRQQTPKDISQKYIFFDFESTQQVEDDGITYHTPNYVCVQKVCGSCIDSEVTADSKCPYCGLRCPACNKRSKEHPDQYEFEPCQGKCGHNQFTFSGETTQDQFCQWLVSPENKGYTVLAHNLKGYDGYFILDYLFQNGMSPAVIYKGSKVIYIGITKLQLRMIDSVNFLPMPLSKLPKCFDIPELCKGWFPFFFNTRQNWNHEGTFENLPPPADYGFDSMTSSAREEFMAWYEQQTGPFNLHAEMEKYCINDVDILRKACLKFRSLMIDITKEGEDVDLETLQVKPLHAVDPFQYLTIASVCNVIFRSKFITESWSVVLKSSGETLSARKQGNKELEVLWNGDWVKVSNVDIVEGSAKFEKSPIAQIPSIGYTATNNFSKISIQWLEWVMHSQDVSIQHALSPAGEKVIVCGNKRYRVDGFCEATNTVYEMQGCFWHGCVTCYRDRSAKSPRTGQTFGELRALTYKRQHEIETMGYNYVEMWECQFNEMLTNNVEARDFVSRLDIQDRLKLRDCFFGGRTGCNTLFHEVSGEEKIKYYDFTSLYPASNKLGKYPVGHPQIMTRDLGTDITPYYGIAKVKVLAPKSLYHPVLPYKTNNKLTFPLCKWCVDNESQEPCKCSKERRSFIGTWTTIELQKAVEMGYVIEKIYEVYHWSQSTQYDVETKCGGLFAEYINLFAKIKTESSNFPSWVKTEADKDVYISNFEKYEGVLLDKTAICHNSGLRSLAKLCLNSFWGYLGKSDSFVQDKFYNDGGNFIKDFIDPGKDISDFHFINDQILHVAYKTGDNYKGDDVRTNVVLAAFTTSIARLHLYQVIEKLGRNCLYTDTDSIHFISKPGQEDPPLGDYLGMLTDELGCKDIGCNVGAACEGHYILAFVSTGPKSYAYVCDNGYEVCKCKGFSLNYVNSKLINMQVMKDMVNDPSRELSVAICEQRKICRDKFKAKLFNRRQIKHFKMIFTKRVIQGDGISTLPYGY